MNKQNDSLRFQLQQYLIHWDLFLLFIPLLLYLIIFHYKPMFGIVIAFKDFKLTYGVWDSEWVGLSNFTKLMRTPSFIRVFFNTIKISLLRIIFGFPMPILFALLLNELHSARYKKVVQTISYLPHFLSWVILGGIFISFLSPTNGPIGSIMSSMGLTPIYFLGNKNWFVPTLIITGIWQSVGWNSIIYLAAISGVSQELYEAAEIDGA
ncbi:MAG TPA: protein lplB, partial [Clostridiales bacterium]|nr:protein lplB [Clostridiales bacterium]